MKFVLFFCSALFLLFCASCERAPKIDTSINSSDLPGNAVIIYQHSNNNDIYRINSNGTGNELVSKESSNIIVSPDHKYFVILSGKIKQGRRTLNDFIYIYKVADGSSIFINDVGIEYLTKVSWSPDSKSILFISNRESNKIKEFDIKTKTVVESYSVDKPTQYPIYDFSFSKDSRYILTNEPSYDCAINDGHVYKKYPRSGNGSNQSKYEIISENEYKTQRFVEFNEVFFYMYDNKKQFSPSKSNYLFLRYGDIVGKNKVIFDYTGPYNPDFGQRGISLANWLSEAYIVFEYKNKIYEMNVDSGQIAFLTDGAHPIVFR